MCRPVLVNTKNGDAFKGTLWKTRGSILVLRAAVLMQRNVETPIDGEVVIFRDNVSFIQVT